MQVADAVGPSEKSLLQLLNAHALRYGREDSFKMAKGRLLADRFLVGVRASGVPEGAFAAIADGIGIPDKLKAMFLQHIEQADTVLFGMEDSDTGLICKVYLEFWQKVRREVLATGRQEPALMNLGFKWYANDSSINVVSRYTCYPMLDLAGMLQRICDIYGRGTARRSCRLALHLVQVAAMRNAPSIYMEVSEDETSRRSYDINLYKANLTLGEVEPVLLEAAARYALPREQFETLYSRLRTRLLGHLSGGLARDGSDFLTVYYETQPL